MQTTQFNHAAQIFANTGHQVIGRPSLGSWLSYGLGSGRTSGVRGAPVGREQSGRWQVVLGQRLPPDHSPGRRVSIQR